MFVCLLLQRLAVAELSDTQICDALKERGFTKREPATDPPAEGVTDEL